ncbi:hypothetical protein BGAL_0544g00060 [Botrytis galanthina]|uniref:Uncharacterized protein n=1 Tax=Botrytis galanthina TaxID=278940 RepID=A0A4S8QPA4_9HELO|nr:hypothetical protein BGAL_0544g00060 [Botrytis galanthina]
MLSIKSSIDQAQRARQRQVENLLNTVTNGQNEVTKQYEAKIDNQTQILERLEARIIASEELLSNDVTNLALKMTSIENMNKKLAEEIENTPRAMMRMYRYRDEPIIAAIDASTEAVKKLHEGVSSEISVLTKLTREAYLENSSIKKAIKSLNENFQSPSSYLGVCLSVINRKLITLSPLLEVISKLAKEETVSKLAKEESISKLAKEATVSKLAKEESISKLAKEATVSTLPTSETLVALTNAITKLPNQETLSSLPNSDSIRRLSDTISKLPSEKALSNLPSPASIRALTNKISSFPDEVTLSKFPSSECFQSLMETLAKLFSGDVLQNIPTSESLQDLTNMIAKLLNEKTLSRIPTSETLQTLAETISRLPTSESFQALTERISKLPTGEILSGLPTSETLQSLNEKVTKLPTEETMSKLITFEDLSSLNDILSKIATEQTVSKLPTYESFNSLVDAIAQLPKEDTFSKLATNEAVSALATSESIKSLTEAVSRLPTDDTVSKLATQETVSQLPTAQTFHSLVEIVSKLPTDETVAKLASEETVSTLPSFSTIQSLTEAIHNLPTNDTVSKLATENTVSKLPSSHTFQSLTGAIHNLPTEKSIAILPEETDLAKFVTIDTLKPLLDNIPNFVTKADLNRLATSDSLASLATIDSLKPILEVIPKLATIGSLKPITDFIPTLATIQTMQPIIDHVPHLVTKDHHYLWQGNIAEIMCGIFSSLYNRAECFYKAFEVYALQMQEVSPAEILKVLEQSSIDNLNAYYLNHEELDKTLKDLSLKLKSLSDIQATEFSLNLEIVQENIFDKFLEAAKDTQENLTRIISQNTIELTNASYLVQDQLVENIAKFSKGCGESQLNILKEVQKVTGDVKVEFDGFQDVILDKTMDLERELQTKMDALNEHIAISFLDQSMKLKMNLDDNNRSKAPHNDKNLQLSAVSGDVYLDDGDSMHLRKRKRSDGSEIEQEIVPEDSVRHNDKPLENQTGGTQEAQMNNVEERAIDASLKNQAEHEDQNASRGGEIMVIRAPMNEYAPDFINCDINYAFSLKNTKSAKKKVPERLKNVKESDLPLSIQREIIKRDLDVKNNHRTKNLELNASQDSGTCWLSQIRELPLGGWDRQKECQNCTRARGDGEEDVACFFFSTRKIIRIVKRRD